MSLDPIRIDIGHIPALYVPPASPPARPRLALFLTGFGGSKEAVVSHLRSFAAAGYLALSIDPYQHGERLHDASVDALRERILANIRRHFWNILGRTTLEIPAVIDYAVNVLGCHDRVAIGGISMGGDISCAAAGIEPRIVAASCGIATPDWLRPGSFEPPGTPDSTAQALYLRLNPITHPDHYAHCPAITFQNGADDDRVPPEASVRFENLLRDSHYRHSPERIEATLHAGISHAYPDVFLANTISWFLRYLPPTGD